PASDDAGLLPSKQRIQLADRRSMELAARRPRQVAVRVARLADGDRDEPHRIALQATDDERAERDVVGQDREHPLDRLLELQVLRDLPPELSFQAHRRPLRSPAACHTGEGCKYVTEKPVYF